MQVTNIHSRTIQAPKEKVAALFETLASKDDQVWPGEQWPKMKFKEGLKVGAKGGHGPIRYSVEQNIPGALLQFRFSQPKGFEGTHQFEMKALDETSTEIKHTIKIQTSARATLLWTLAIRSLHDALLEDAFDKVENHFSGADKKTPWTLWVKILRSLSKWLPK